MAETEEEEYQRLYRDNMIVILYPTHFKYNPKDDTYNEYERDGTWAGSHKRKDVERLQALLDKREKK